jgi:formamidopyrimidine-DNA glycosylase
VPELPEVETVRRQLEPQLVGRGIVGAAAFPSGKFTDATAAIGCGVTGVRRRGKYLLMDLRPGDADERDDLELVVHLGMTGRLAVGDRRRRVGPGEPHLRATWDLDDGRQLTFDDVRRFGRIAVVPLGEHRSLPTLAALGPEPFDDGFSPQALRDHVRRSRRALKTQLLSQRPVAGVGNIYADEALWLARVHPAARRLGPVAAERLHAAIREVLAAGIEDGGTTLRDYRDARGARGTHQDRLHCYGRDGQPCDRCGTALRRTVIDARSTTFCPLCQRR